MGCLHTKTVLWGIQAGKVGPIVSTTSHASIVIHEVACEQAIHHQCTYNFTNNQLASRYGNLDVANTSMMVF